MAQKEACGLVSQVQYELEGMLSALRLEIHLPKQSEFYERLEVKRESTRFLSARLDHMPFLSIRDEAPSGGRVRPAWYV